MFTRVWKFLLEIWKKWRIDKGPLLAAGLAFHATLAIVPFLMVIFLMAAQFIGEGPAKEALMKWIALSLDAQAAEMVRAILRTLRNSEAGAVTIFSALFIVFGATNVFRQISAALNVIWPDGPRDRKNLWLVIRARVLAIVMVLLAGLFLLISMLSDAFLRLAMGKFIHVLPDIDLGFWSAINYMVPLGMFVLIFACLYRFLPRSKVRWREAWIGAGVAAVFFAAGRFLLGIFFSYSPLVSIYGSIGSLIVVMLWIYLLAQIFLLGAEITEISGRSPKG